ncbi:MAG: DUF3540 domain-containing protein [Gammaproteobacteria bacterium]|nr:DUF3540 domain-containing protein [Gammaproteobacteria bacterium]
MNPIKQLVQPGRAHELLELRVTAAQEADVYLLSDGRGARAAVSCLLRPAVGDRVLVSDSGAEVFILHILAREPGGRASLSVPGADEVCLEQERVTLRAHRRLALHSLRDLELTAAATLSQSAANQFVHVAQALIETLNQHVSHAHTRTWESEALLAMHAGQVLFTAESDFRVDAERISLG